MTDPRSRLASHLSDRFTIGRELGAGGMATVYLAEDVRHGRQVALKVLRPELAGAIGAERFLREIETVARLTHPHILPMHDSGEAGGLLYYVMPYVEGETLEGRLAREGELSVAEALRIAAECAEALEHAHAQGVIHRDLKPANILFSGGHAVVADFGIARVLEDTADEHALTNTGVSIGTVGYMSPEQATGERTVDERTDVYALGCVLYEMLTAEPAFSGRTAQAVMAKQLMGEVPSVRMLRPGVPEELDEVVGRALQPRPADRFESVGELREELVDRVGGTSMGQDWSSGRRGMRGAEPDSRPPGAKEPDRSADPAAASDRTSILVTPFENGSPDPENEYVADGLTDEIITDLSKVRSLRVISRSSAMRLKGSSEPFMEAARRLEVDYVLEGSVRKAGADLRITVRLVDVASDDSQWSERYDGTFDELFAIQSRVARSVAEQLEVHLSGEELRAIDSTELTDPRAYESFLRARYETWHFSRPGLESAERHLKHGLALAGENVLLYACLGLTYAWYGELGLDPDGRYLDKARECVERIFALQSDAPRGHWLQGVIRFRAGELRAAKAPLERALEGLPDDPDVMMMLGYLCALRGQHDRARRLFERCKSIDPLTPLNNAMPGFVDTMEGRPEDAVEGYRTLLEMDPESPFALWCWAWILMFSRKWEELEEVVPTLVEQHPDSMFAKLGSTTWSALTGDRETALSGITDELRAAARTSELFSRELTHCLALAGENEEALEWLENTIRIGNVNYPFWSEHDWMVDNLRREPRFRELMEQVKREWQTLNPELAG